MLGARFVVTISFLFTLALGAVCPAQESNESTASCNLDDGRQVYIRYTPVTTKAEKVSNGKPWAPEIGRAHV